MTLQNFVDRSLPTIKAAWLNPVDRIKETYDRTNDEITLGITPANTGYYIGHILRYGGNWLQAFRVSSLSKVKVQVPGGTYTINAQVEHTGDVDIEFLGPATINNTSAGIINSIFKITGKLRIYGSSVTFDGNDLAYLLVHCPTIFPEIDNATFKDCLSVAVLPGRNFGGANPNDYSGSNGVGHGWLRNCKFENVGSIAIPNGSGKASDTSFGLVECVSDTACGDITNLFNLGAMGYGYVHGGWFKGVSSTAPNMTDCARCEYIGGRYEGLTRGPTTGEESDYVTIVGGISINCSFSGVSIDARITGSNEVPVVNGSVHWTFQGPPPSHGIFLQASGISISTFVYVSDGTATSGNNVVRLTDALNVRIGNITARGAGGALVVSLGAGAAPSPGSSAFKTGEWESDTTSVTPIRCSSNLSTLTMGQIRSLSANGDIGFLDKVVLVDASAGVVDVDVPPLSVSENIIGHVWDVIVINSTNNVTITRDGGGATAINGGASFTIAAGGNFRAVRITSIGGGNYYVSVSV